MDKKIILIVGKSASGKSTIVDKLCESNKQYKQLNSYTTRQKRSPNEKGHIFVNADDYIFTNTNGQTKIQTKDGQEIKVMAYTFFNNNHYWADLNQVQESNFYIIDKKGIDEFRLKAKEYNINFKVVYIHVPFLARCKRLIKRDGIKKGLSRLINDFKMFRGLTYDFKIVNDDLDKSVKILKYFTKFISSKERKE